MKGNALLKFGIPAVLFILIFVFFNIIRSPNTTDNTAAGENIGDLGISVEDAKLLGIEGDTPKDTLATLVGHMKSARKEIQDVKKQNEDLAKENERLRQREGNIDARIDTAVRTAAEKTANRLTETEEQAKGILSDIQTKFNELGSQNTAQVSANANTEEDIPVGLGLQEGDGKQFGSVFGESFNLPIGRQANTRKTPGASGTLIPASFVWVEPLDGIQTDPKTNQPLSSNVTFPNEFKETALMPFKELSDSERRYRAVAKGERDLDNPKKRNEDTKPYYTIAENSTLMGSKVMTALIGRVPIDGTVSDPYPFKVLIGKDNLAANGIDLPDVASAVMSGVATGDWTLSCVRGQVESITFVFEDGTIRTVPEPEATVKRGQSNTTSTSINSGIRGGIGYISDPHGIPCVSGVRKSNAKQYLSTQSLVTAAGAGVAALFSEDDNSSYSGSGTVISDRNAALNTILSGGVNDIRSWVNKLYGQAFAAIYVPPHAEIAVHIDRELTIDYEPHGRKVNYHADAANFNDLP